MSPSSPSDELFAQRLREAREMRGLSQAELGTKTGLQPAAVSHFETGARRPSFDNLRRLAVALEVSTDYLLGRVDTPEGAPVADVAFRDYQQLSEPDRLLVQGLISSMRERAEPGADAVFASRNTQKTPRGRKPT
jgi:transcriptional regulator with XRE-family HTH domain